MRQPPHKLTANGCICGTYCPDAERWETQAETVRRMTRQGYSAQQIAHQLNVSERTIQRHRKRLGITQQSPREKHRQLRAQGHQCTRQCAINHRHHQGRKAAA